MTNQLTITLVAVFLGMFALLGLGATAWLIHDGVDASTVAVITTPTGVALGAMAALLASTRSGPMEVQPVPPKDPA